MDAFDPNTSESDLGEMLESFRWTQRLAQRLVLDPALAADVSQDAWTRALERFGSRLPDRAWLAGTIRSLAFRGKRSRRRRAHHEGQVSKAHSEISAAELIERSETQQRVASAVNALAPEQRIVVLLRFQEGLPLDYTPGENQIRVSSKGYVTQIFSTSSHIGSAPHLTLPLRASPGISGRLLENGEPVAFERVFLSNVSLVLARPRESLEHGEATRLESVVPKSKELSGRSGYSPQYLLGLDGPPPPYHLEGLNNSYGTRTDAEGRFRFRPVDRPAINLHLQREGEAKRAVGTFTIEGDECPLGDLELGASASLSGRFEVRGPWSPEEYEIALEPSGIEARLQPDGSFEFQGLQSGDQYVRLRWNFDESQPSKHSSFANLPVFHLSLEPGESREIVIDLDPYRGCQLELTFNLAGSPPAKTFKVELWPVLADARTFRARGEVEGHHFSGRANALGLCRVRINQATPNGGWITLESPTTILDLQPGTTVKHTIEIDAGQIRLQLPLGHPAAALKHLDLILEGGGTQLGVIGIRTVKPAKDQAGAEAVATTGWIPPGTYRARLFETTWKRDYETRRTLAEFEAIVPKNETFEQWLDF